MPITTTFNTQRSVETTESILREFVRDFFDTSYIVTFERPGDPVRPTFWFDKMPSRNREVRTYARGKKLQREEMIFAVSILTRDRVASVRMADTLKQAVLASGSSLAVAGLRYVELSPFQDIPVTSQPNAFQRTATLRATATLEA